MKQHDNTLHCCFAVIVSTLIFTVVINLPLPIAAASAVYPILKVGNDFTLSQPSAIWRTQASTINLQEELDFGEGRQVNLQVHLFYNDSELLWGIDIRGFSPNCPDDYTPDFSGSDHLKLQFILRVKGKDYPGSLLILPDSIFQTPLVTPDYSYYQNQSGLPSYGIHVASSKEIGELFIRLAIPYTALNAEIPVTGDTLDFKIGFVLNGSLGRETQTIWIPIPGDSLEYNTARFE